MSPIEFNGIITWTSEMYIESLETSVGLQWAYISLNCGKYFLFFFKNQPEKLE